MNGMDDLLEWLRAQLEQELQEAFAAGATLRGGGGTTLDWRAAGSAVLVDGMRSPLGEPPIVRARFMEDMPGYEVERARALRIAAHDPDRVLCEIDAKLKIVERYAGLCEHGDTGNTAWVLQVLALPYADRPGYREEWRP
ncbi:DUF6221 family protein [Streptomyces sp. NPDC101249]|uniref:DUF6221 family protein n=1 Tax=Streptomyces sp. NPDC101249 TaxID=3366140 RepID=UPI0037F7D916